MTGTITAPASLQAGAPISTGRDSGVCGAAVPDESVTRTGSGLFGAVVWLDGEPVHVFVLLISPQDRPGDHLRALENVSRCLRDDGFVRSLRQSPSREAIWSLLDDADHHP